MPSLAFLKKFAICDEFRDVSGGAGRVITKVTVANWITTPIFHNVWISPDNVSPALSIPVMHTNNAMTKGQRGTTNQVATAELQSFSISADSMTPAMVTSIISKLMGNTSATGTYADMTTAVGAGVIVPDQASSEPLVVDVVWDDTIAWYTAGIVIDGFTFSGSHNSPNNLSFTAKLFDAPVTVSSIGAPLLAAWAPDYATGTGIMGFNYFQTGRGGDTTTWSGSVTYSNPTEGRWDANRAGSKVVSNILYTGDLSAEFSWKVDASIDEKLAFGTEVSDVDIEIGPVVLSATKVLITSVAGSSELGQATIDCTGTTRSDTSAVNSAILIATGTGI